MVSHTFPDPADPDYVYAEYQGGFAARINRYTHEARQHSAQGELQGKAALQLEHSDRRFA